MASVTLVGYDALHARLERVGHVDARLMKMLLLQSQREAKLLVPRRTGNLSRSIVTEQTSETSGRLIARADYAADVEFGTKPHDIAPRAKLALRFALGAGARLTGSARSGADVIFARLVHHPGTKPHPYLIRGAQAAIRSGGLEKEVVLAWEGEA